MVFHQLHGKSFLIYYTLAIHPSYLELNNRGFIHTILQ